MVWTENSWGVYDPHDTEHVKRIKLPVLLHDVFKWSEKIFLESEIGKLAFLDKLGS